MEQGKTVKQVLAGAALLFTLTGNGFAGETVTIPVEDYRAILQRLDALQQRVDVLEARPVTPVAPATPVNEARVAKVEQDVKDIYDGMDEIETRQLQNRINFGTELRTRVDSYKVKNYPYDGDRINDSNNWTNRFRINMDATITESLSFHGRLAMFKNWGDSDDGTASGLVNDSNRVHVPGTSNLWVDRAYVDWVPEGMPIPLAITIGRQPSTEGPSFEFKENRLRQSTYSALLFNGESDGIVATLGLERYTGLAETGLRFGYSKLYHSDDENNSGNAFPFLDDHETIDSNVFGLVFESELPGLPGSLGVLSYAEALELPLWILGPVQNVEAGIPPNVNLGDMSFWGAHFQVRNVMDSDTDLFFSYGGNRSNPNGVAVFPYGLLSAEGQEAHTGSSVYVGFRYTFPFEQFNRPKVGVEFNHGSRYWFSMTMGTADLFNKLATRGDVVDFYYIQPVNQYLFFRAGYMHVAYDYTGSGWYCGEPLPTDAVLENYYLLIDIRF